MAPLAHVDAVRCIGKSGLSLPLVRVYRDAAGPPLLVRAQVSHHLAPQDDSARVGVSGPRPSAPRTSKRKETTEAPKPPKPAKPAGGPELDLFG